MCTGFTVDSAVSLSLRFFLFRAEGKGRTGRGERNVKKKMIVGFGQPKIISEAFLLFCAWFWCCCLVLLLLLGVVVVVWC